MPTQTAEEQLVAQWQEPEQAHSQFSARVSFLLILGGIGLSIAVSALGYWLKEVSFYVASGVVVMGVVAMIVQNKRPAQLKTITITNQRLGIDERELSLSELAGFWLQQEAEGLVVTVEHKKPALIPVTFFFANSDREAAQKTLLQVLPELEPRASHFTDRFSSYFRI